MAKTAKYIVVKHDGAEKMIIFDESIMHADMARLMRCGKPLSAGFICITSAPNGDGQYSEYPRVRCYGYSESLRTGPRDQDDMLARQTLDLRQD